MPVQIQDFYHLGRVLAVKDYSFSLESVLRLAVMHRSWVS